MTNKRSNAKPAEQSWSEGTTPIVSAFQSAPAMVIGRRIAFEGTRFWAKRVHAFVDQMEALAHCNSPSALIELQSKFFKQMQQDYLSENETVTGLLSTRTEPEFTPRHDSAEQSQPTEH